MYIKFLEELKYMLKYCRSEEFGNYDEEFEEFYSYEILYRIESFYIKYLYNYVVNNNKLNKFLNKYENIFGNW